MLHLRPSRSNDVIAVRTEQEMKDRDVHVPQRFFLDLLPI